MANGSCWLRRLAPPALVCMALAETRAEAQVVPGPGIPIPSGRRVGPELLVVDDTLAACRFSFKIQDAVDAAEDGDVILVKKGSYRQFVVDGKSVGIFGEAGPSGTSVQVDGLTVKNLRSDQFVVLRALTVGRPGVANAFSNNAGPIWIEDCKFTTKECSIASSSNVGMFNSSVVISGLPRTDLSVSSSNLFAYGSSFTGGPGYPGVADEYCDGLYYYYYGCQYCPSGIFGCRPGTDGLPGLLLSSAGHAFVFGGQVVGGPGGAGITAKCCSAPAGGIGPAMNLAAGTSVVSMDATLTGGVSGAGTSTTLTGRVGGYSSSNPVEAGTSAVLEFTGPAGWNVFLTYGLDYVPAYVPSGKGYSVVDPHSPTIFIGALPASGSLQVSMPFNLPPSVRASVLFSQAELQDPVRGTPYLAEPSALLVVRDPCP